MSDDVIHLRVHFRVFKALLSRSIHNGFGHGVREVFFQACCDPQHFIVGFITEVDDGSYDRHGFRQRSRLIEYDSRCFSNSFHVFAALDHDVVLSGLSDRRKHRHRHSQFQCTGKVDHQNGQRLGSISGKKPYQCSSQQCIRNQSVRQMFRLALGRGFQFVRFFDHGYDLFVFRGSSRLFDADDKLPFFYNCSGVRVTVCILFYSKRFARHSCLVYHRFSGTNDAVERDDVTHMHDYKVSCLYFIRRHQHFGVILPDPYFFGIERHAPREIADRLLMCPIF